MNKQILRLAVPNIFSNVTVPLLSIVDISLMGWQENNAAMYIAAVGLGAMIFNFLYWGFGFLRMGTTGLTAQAFGSKNTSKIAENFLQAFFIAICSGILLLLLQSGIEYVGFTFIETSPETEKLARSYFNIRIWAAPAVLGIYVLNGWFLGMQNAIFPMTITLLVNVFNIIFNVIFVKYYGMTSDGVALGTLFAQYGGFVVGLALFLKKYNHYFKHFKAEMITKWQKYQQFFAVNRDIFLRTMSLIFVFTFFRLKSAEQGETTFAANEILMELLMVMAYAVDGFAYAAEGLVGKYVGAKNAELLKKSIRYCMIWGIGFSLLFSVFYGVMGDVSLQIFTNDPEILSTAHQYLTWMIFIPVLGAIAFVWDGIYIGATASVPMRNTMIFASFFVFLPAFYLTLPYLGNHALWLAMLLYMGARAVSMTWLWGRG